MIRASPSMPSAEPDTGSGDASSAREYSPHGLRHAFASACDDVDRSELTIAMLLGHASAKKGSTTRRYISRPDAVVLAAADKVGRYIWQAMTGEASSGQVVDLPRRGVA